jgi:hypothetical protein
MTIEEITIFGFIFAAVTLSTMAYERRMDVLYGPYLEDRTGHTDLSVSQFWKPMQSVADGFRWKARNMLYLTALIAC